MKFQSAPGYFCSVVVCVISKMLFTNGEFKKHKTGFLAGFLFLMNLPFLFQTNKLNISYNLTHHKTLHT